MSDGEIGSEIDETNRLLLMNLPAHTNIHISFDLFILGDWRGYGTGGGAHRWNCGVVGSPKSLLTTSFSGEIERRQSFPGTHPNDDNYYASGAVAINSLGGLSGALEGPSAYFMKSPPVQHRDEDARHLVEAFIAEHASAQEAPTLEAALTV